VAHAVNVDLQQNKDFRFAGHLGGTFPVRYGNETSPPGNCIAVTIENYDSEGLRLK
jgi:hypothetical protein